MWNLEKCFDACIRGTYVTIPADSGDTERFVPKLSVAATPTKDPSSLILIPELSAVTPVRFEPSPLKDDAVIIPLDNLSERSTAYSRAISNNPRVH